jgi:tRNA modification GTPase
MSTIYALSSGRGRAGVAVIRVSGEKAGDAVKALTKGDLTPPRQAALRWLYTAEDGQKLDQALILWFPGPDSFTGEDVAEFHVHGGLAVVSAVLDAVGQVDGARIAEPGEFARRAFENGRFDLTVAEGLGDLIDAETEAQRRQAVRQMGGELFRVYEDWRECLIEAMAMVEVGIDFADEDLPEDVNAAARPIVETLSAEIRARMDDGGRGERIRDGVEVAILGEPNVGKSSLLNLLARRDVAIVSDIAGTTRDMLEVHLDLKGYPVTLVDTAGIREAGDRIEEEGIRRARARAESADLRILMVDARDWPTLPESMKDWAGARSLVVVNKTDAVPDLDLTAGLESVHGISAKTGAGVDELVDALGKKVGDLFRAGEPPVITRARHRRALDDCLHHLDAYLDGEADIELAAEELRLAARALGRVTGRVDVEDILDVVFGSFCIGK